MCMETTVDRPTLVFDDSCPLCQAYTGAFERLGWADRQSFSTCADLASLDLDRARHEIPMFDGDSVRYGLDSLFTVLGGQLPLLEPILRHRVTAAVLGPVYSFISYNRREIAGCPPPDVGFDCAPDFHAGWKLAYVGAASGVTVAAIAGSAPAAVAALAGTAVATVEYGPDLAAATAEGAVEMTAHGLTAVAAGAVAARVVGGPLGALAGTLVGLHQLYRRRWVS